MKLWFRKYELEHYDLTLLRLEIHFKARIIVVQCVLPRITIHGRKGE